MAKDYYRILGVPRDATAKQIKEAYRKLSRKWHPDINPGNKEAEEKFKEISSAYDVLGSEDKRRLYDEFGEEVLHPGFDEQRARQYQQWSAGAQPGAGAVREPGGEWSAEDFGRFRSYEDLFGNIFDYGFGQEGQTFREQARGKDLEYEMSIDLIPALKGFETEIAMDKTRVCPTCQGSGIDPQAGTTTCTVCDGSGRVSVARGPMQFTKTCPHCRGTGKMGKPCPTCAGQGMVPGVERIKVAIPPGVREGSRVRVAGKGEPAGRSGTPGDLYLIIHVREHPVLRREGDNLAMDVPVTVREAMAGGAITVPTVDGRIKVKVPPGSQSGQVLKVRGKGALNPKTKKHGDLLIRLVVKVPRTEDREALDAAEKIDRLYAGDVREGLRF